MKQIICDKCRKAISEDAYKIVVGTVGADNKLQKEFSEQTSKMDFCESCIKKMFKIYPEKNDICGGEKIGVDVDKIYALKDAGWTNTKIADEVGLTPATVGCHLKKRKG